MRKGIMILGTVLIAAVLLISGSAVATIYATSVYSDINCENSENALYEEDGEWATVGTNTPSTLLGSLILDFGFVGIPDSTTVTVFGQDGAGEDESYEVRFLLDDLTPDPLGWQGPKSDQDDQTFTTRNSGPDVWEFIEIRGYSGQTGPTDLIYGPEIDAVGY